MLKQDCIPEGCVPPACCPYLPACTAGGCLLQEGVPAPGDACFVGGLLPGGCRLWGCLLGWGACIWSWGGACLGGGGVCSWGEPASGPGVGGLLLEGCLVWRVSAPGRCLLWGGYLPLVLGGVTQHAMGQTPL